MQISTPVPSSTYPPLETVTRPRLTTNEAAFYLNRKPPTLHTWASVSGGPIKPTRVHGRLAWSTDDVRRVLGVAA